MMTPKYTLKTQTGGKHLPRETSPVITLNSIMKETNIILSLAKTTVPVTNAATLSG